MYKFKTYKQLSPSGSRRAPVCGFPELTNFNLRIMALLAYYTTSKININSRPYSLVVTLKKIGRMPDK